MNIADIQKGTRIRARWFKATMASLTGMQMKVGAQEVVVTGTVRHIRVNPTNPTDIRLYVESDDGLGSPCAKCQVWEIDVNPRHVVEVLS